jgi:hypothetical protein
VRQAKADRHTYKQIYTVLTSVVNNKGCGRQSGGAALGYFFSFCTPAFERTVLSCNSYAKENSADKCGADRKRGESPRCCHVSFNGS